MRNNNKICKYRDKNTKKIVQIFILLVSAIVIIFKIEFYRIFFIIFDVIIAIKISSFQYFFYL